MGDDWSFPAPAWMEMLWEQQIPNAGSINFAGGHSLWSVFIPADRDKGEDALPTSRFDAEQTHTQDKLP